MKKLPLGIQNFPEIRNGNYVYIDKTPMAFNLAENGKYYFLSRPRRFGKSLFLDTLKCLFEGKKELFEGLYIYDKWDWSKKYPVIKISFGADVFKSSDHLEKAIVGILEKNERDNGVAVQNKATVGNYFKFLIEACYVKHNKRVVVVIDEYDKPILDNITDESKALEMRNNLRNLYSVIKDSDEYIKFTFLTGVSKFSKMNLFSGLNNLQDITLLPEYATICGYTQNDVEVVFKDYIKLL
ncbi:MAG: AAA family ATPase, partial [Desulfamplus sp.]|nr:AAA family ATPase [Desulfamplus sp.]